MEWLILAAPVPGPVEFTVGGGAVFATLLVTVLTPIVLAVRHALTRGTAGPELAQLRVIEGGKELKRQAA
ncbi:MAG TPA: hypothetical protein VMW56_27405 [Candidatus Margulisiibacteriota bacterium]|nr:hypothetical protein [Candidatus Margulisiibacteriota bacterium]